MEKQVTEKNILFRDTLSTAEQDALRRLTERCNQADSTSYSVPDDADLIFLLTEEISAALCVYHMGETKDGLEIDELVCLTLPEKRRQGYCTALLREAAPLLRPMLRFCAEPTEPAEAFLHSLGAAADHDEFLLVRDLAKMQEKEKNGVLPCMSDGRETDSGEDVSPVPLSLASSEDGDRTMVTCRYGQCMLSRWGAGDTQYLSGMLIYDRWRGKGWGTRFLTSLFPILKRENVSRLFLHVSSENQAAVRLYRKTGFSAVVTLRYFYLPKSALKRLPGSADEAL